MEIVVIDAWKALKIGDSSPLLVREFAGILTKKLVKEAYDLKHKDKVCKDFVENVVMSNTEYSSSVSTHSMATAHFSHTNIFL